MKTLTACIITLNEEEHIGRCLESLQGVADDILVVDSFSKDRTEPICRDHGARFMQHAFEGYVEQVRYAVALAQGDWVLSIDADEALSPRLRDSIQRIKSDGDCDAYACNRLNHYRGRPIRHGAWYPDRKVRLWRNGAGEYGGLNPHYSFKLREGLREGFLKGQLLHYSYDSLDSLFTQAAKFACIGAEELHARGKRASFAGLPFRPFFRFFRDYIVKAGFLDGADGAFIALSAAYGNFLKYARLRELNRCA